MDKHEAAPPLTRKAQRALDRTRYRQKIRDAVAWALSGEHTRNAAQLAGLAHHRDVDRALDRLGLREDYLRARERREGRSVRRARQLDRVA